MPPVATRAVVARPRHHVVPPIAARQIAVLVVSRWNVAQRVAAPIVVCPAVVHQATIRAALHAAAALRATR